MREETFSISILELTCTKLKDMLERYKTDPNDEAVKDALIKRFEYTYSTLLATLKKYFSTKPLVSENVERLSFNEMVRTANRFNLLKSNLETWTKFRAMRNMTAHSYDEATALKIIESLPEFYDEVTFLINKLKDELNGRA